MIIAMVTLFYIEFFKTRSVAHGPLVLIFFFQKYYYKSIPQGKLRREIIATKLMIFDMAKECYICLYPR